MTVSLLDAIRGRTMIQPHELAATAGVSRAEAEEFMNELVAAGKAKPFLLVYHGCCDVPVSRWAFGDGKRVVPLGCPECDDTVQLSEITYDWMVEIKQ